MRMISSMPGERLGGSGDWAGLATAWSGAGLGWELAGLKIPKAPMSKTATVPMATNHAESGLCGVFMLDSYDAGRREVFKEVIAPGRGGDQQVLSGDRFCGGSEAGRRGRFRAQEHAGVVGHVISGEESQKEQRQGALAKSGGMADGIDSQCQDDNSIDEARYQQHGKSRAHVGIWGVESALRCCFKAGQRQPNQAQSYPENQSADKTGQHARKSHVGGGDDQTEEGVNDNAKDQALVLQGLASDMAADAPVDSPRNKGDDQREETGGHSRHGRYFTFSRADCILNRQKKTGAYDIGRSFG